MHVALHAYIAFNYTRIYALHEAAYVQLQNTSTQDPLHLHAVKKNM